MRTGEIGESFDSGQLKSKILKNCLKCKNIKRILKNGLEKHLV